MNNQKTWKRLASCITAVCLVSVSTLQITDRIITAEAVEDAETAYVTDAIVDYVKCTDYASVDEVELSTCLNYYDYSTMEVCGNAYVVSYCDAPIGIMYLNKTNGKYASSYSKGVPVCIQTAFAKGEDIALGCCNGEAVMYDGEDFFSTRTGQKLDGIEMENGTQSLSESAVEDVVLTPADTVSRVVPIASVNSNVIIGTSVYVEPVPNETINGDGICWAASIAEKYNYENGVFEGDAGYKSARDVYNTITAIYGGYQKGYDYVIKRGLLAYGLYSNCSNHSMNVTEVMTEIAHNNPILINIRGRNSSGKIVAHSVVVSGATYYDEGHALYTLADPNCEYEMLARVENAAYSGDDFSYLDKDHGFTFTEWYTTFSYSTYYNNGEDKA